MKSLKKQQLLICFCFLVSNLFAADYYVTNGGNDNRPGTEQSPWASCPGMPGWSGTVQLSPGDRVYFNKGGAWGGSGNEALTLTGGVTYIGNEWGSGARAKLKPTGRCDAIVTINQDHESLPTIIKGFEMDGKSGNCSGICYLYPSSYRNLTGAVKRIEDCIVYNCGGSGYDYGIVVSDKQGYTIANVEVLNVTLYNVLRSGIVVYVGNETGENKCINALVRGCEVYNSGIATDSAGFGILLKNHVINPIVEFNFSHDNPGGGIDWETAQTGYTGSENGKLRYNIVKNNGGSGFYGQLTGAKSLEVYGNLVFKNAGCGMNLANSSSQGLSLKIYNNTFYQNCLSVGDAEIDIGDSAVYTGLEFKNNIIYPKLGKKALVSSTAKITAHSNNIYYREDGDVLVTYGGNSYKFDTIKTWEPTAFTEKPAFKDAENGLPGGFRGTYGTDLVPNNDGFLIMTGEAVNNGADLGAEVNGAINLSGVNGNLKRPQGSGWDIGAYEFTSGVFLALKDGDKVSGNVNVLATTAGNDSVELMEFYLDDVFMEALTSTPYKWAWDTKTVKDGTHKIKIIGHYPDGRTSVDYANVSVKNSQSGNSAGNLVSGINVYPNPCDLISFGIPICI